METVVTLTHLGYNVLTAKSGERAIETVSSGVPIDLILMDVDLGKGIDGPETAERIMPYRDIPVLFLSSYTEKEVVDRTERISSYGYVVKQSGDVVLNASIKMAFKLHAEKLHVQAEQEKLEKLNRQLEATIEERKCAGDLAARHADFRERVFNSLDAALAVVMPDGVISEVNEAWRRFALANNGTDESTWGRGANYFREARPEFGDTTSALEAYEGLRRVQRGELDFFTLEYPCHSPLKNRWFIMRAMPLKGWPGTVLVSHTDITAAWENRVALEGSQRLLALSQEIAHVGSWELDVVAGNLTWSDETFRIFGAEPQEFTPTYDVFLEFVHPEDQAAVDEAYTGSLREGQSGYEIEHRIIHKGSGEVRFVREKCIHYRDPAGTVIRSTGMIEDITERVQSGESLQRAVEALQTSEELFRNVFEHHNAVKLLLDPATGCILDANEAAVAFYGWPKEQLLRMRITDINTLSPRGGTGGTGESQGPPAHLLRVPSPAGGRFGPGRSGIQQQHRDRRKGRVALHRHRYHRPEAGREGKGRSARGRAASVAGEGPASP